jgi:RNA polymerase sigma factor (sigma-70 family)
MNEQLVLDYIPLAIKMARLRSLSAPPSVSFEDLRSAAYLGLVDAASRFDSSRGFAFASYARLRIDGEMTDHMRSSFLGANTRFMIDGEDFPEDSEPESPHLDFSCLDSREARIVRLHYFDNRTLKDIGDSEGVGESRISQILGVCRIKLKRNLKREVVR